MKFSKTYLRIALVAILIAVIGPMASGCTRPEYQEMSASGYAFQLKDGEGDSIFSVSDAGNTSVAGTLDAVGATGITGALDVTGALNADGATTLGALTTTGVTAIAVGTEHIGLPSVISSDIAFGTLTGTVATIADGEVWFVHAVFVQTTTNFNCTGDDCTLTIGDGGDPNGLLDLVDAELQAAAVQVTGAQAGWHGSMAATLGAYMADGVFVYAPSGAAETIDYAIAGTDPAAGAATVYVVYTRIQ